MRNARVILSVMGVLAVGFCTVSNAAAQDDFSGVWILDKGKSHDLPSGLKSYTMVVKQNDQQLLVETKVEGDLRPPGGGGFPGGPGNPRDMPPGHPIDNPPSQRPGGGGSLGGGPGANGFPSGPPGGPVEGGIPNSGPPSGTLALRIVIPKATYSLDGEETTAPLEEPRAGTARLKAKWMKDKKGLELSSTRAAEFSDHSGMLTSKERWTLAEGGEVLKVQRSVVTPQGTDMVRLTFRKGKAETPAASDK